MFKYRKRLKMFRPAILGFTFVFLFPALSSADQSLIDGAKKEKELSIYSVMALDVINQTLNNFKKKYPFLKVGLYRAGTQKVLTRTMAETRAGRFIADAYVVKARELSILRDNNLLMKYESPEGKNYRKDFKEPNGYWTVGYVAARVLGYNTRLVSEQDAPKSYEDLLDPKWKGKIGIPMQRYAWFGTMCKAWGEEKAVSYFKKLVAQDLQYHNGLTLNANLLAAGEFSVLVIVSSRSMEYLKEKGAPVEWVRGGPVVVDATASGISAKAPHPNAAKLFTDYYLSKENQEFMRDIRYIPGHPDVKPNPPRMLIDKQFSFSSELIYKDLEYYTKLYKTIFPQ